MVIELKFSKFDNTPWGFRLTGGSDFDVPLTVIKVTDGSLAEASGMKFGDQVVRINDTAMAGLTHAQAHEVILQAGNNFAVGVIRSSDETHRNTDDSTKNIYDISSNMTIDPLQPACLLTAVQEQSVPTNDLPQVVIETPREQHAVPEVTAPAQESQIREGEQTLDSEIQPLVSEGSSDLVSKPDPTMSDDQIAEMISGEAEVLPVDGQPVLGVNFQKFIPKVDFIKDSDVFKTLNQEATESSDEKLKKDHQWSKFLVKPDRPKPKPKPPPYEGPKEPPYKVIIKKIKKIRDDTKPAESVPEENSTDAALGTEEPERPPTEMSGIETTDTEGVSMSEGPFAEDSSAAEHLLSESLQEQAPVSASETEQSMEDQLAEVQKQLLALSQLPATIQATLDAVTKQLSKFIPAVKEEVPQDETAGELTEGEFTEDEHVETEEHDQAIENEIPTIEEETEPGFTPTPTPELILTPEPEEILTPEERERRDKELKEFERQHEEERKLQEEHMQMRIKQQAKPFFPSTPLQRPIVLPGGRKWRRPDDVCPTKVFGKQFTDEHIAETISSQSEIITGTTLGINFLKYQTPPKSLDFLKHSEVYKMIQSLDLPQRGVAGRPSLVNAEEDFYRIHQKHEDQPHNLQSSVELSAQMEP